MPLLTWTYITGTKDVINRLCWEEKTFLGRKIQKVFVNWDYALLDAETGAYANLYVTGTKDVIHEIWRTHTFLGREILEAEANRNPVLLDVKTGAYANLYVTGTQDKINGFARKTKTCIAKEIQSVQVDWKSAFIEKDTGKYLCVTDTNDRIRKISKTRQFGNRAVQEVEVNNVWCLLDAETGRYVKIQNSDMIVSTFTPTPDNLFRIITTDWQEILTDSELKIIQQ